MEYMELTPPRLVSAHGVLGLPVSLPLSADVDEQLVVALRAHFPNVVMRQPPLVGMASEGPRLVLTSTSSQLAIAAGQADLEVRFYGEYESRPELCLKYAHDKLEAVRVALVAQGIPPAMVGLVMQLQYSFTTHDFGTTPVEHILTTHLKLQTDASQVEDAVARVAVRVAGKYFVSLRVAPYAIRLLERPIMPGTRSMIIKPWEGKLSDEGIGLTVDVNNTLEGRTLDGDPQVSEAGIAAVTDLVRRGVTEVGRSFVETGKLGSDAFVEQLV
jgi:hypothetical protein